MTLDARERFRNSPHAKTWQDVVDSAQFQEAATAGMTMLSKQACLPAYMEGGWQFLEILMNLTAPVPQPGQLQPQNLDHTV